MKKKTKKKGRLLKLALCVFIVYIGALIFQQQVQIKQKQAQLAGLNSRYSEVQSQNAELQKELSDNDSQFILSVARDKLGYAKPDDRVYIDVSGN